MYDLEGCGRIICDFCREQIAPEDAVAGDNCFICRKCATLIHNDTENRKREAKRYSENVIEQDEDKPLKKPIEIRKELDEYVIGQEEAKRKLSVAVYHHYLRVKRGLPTQGRNNLMLVGPTGCGKTFIVQTLAKIVGLPLFIGDSTSLTEAGYVGQDVESILKGLVNAAGGNPNYARKGIIYLDEVDKIAERTNPGTGRDVGGGGVQEALLKMIEGKICTFNNSSGSSVTLDTSEILFIFGGAFSDMHQYCVIEKKSGSIGFHSEPSVIKEIKFEDVVNELNHKDFIRYGMKPEFIGRVPIILHFHPLEKDDLCNILTSVKDSIVKMVEEIFAADGIRVKIPQETIEAIANLALENGTGARGLRTIVERSLFDSFYELPSSDTKKFVFTPDMVK